MVSIRQVLVILGLGIILTLNLVVLTSSVHIRAQQTATGRWVDLGGGKGACICPNWDGCVCIRPGEVQ